MVVSWGKTWRETRLQCSMKESKILCNPKTLKDSENQTGMLILIFQEKKYHVDSDVNGVEQPDSKSKDQRFNGLLQSF